MSLVIILGLCLPYFIGWMLLERLLCSRHCSGCGNRAVNRGDGAGGGGPPLWELSFPQISFARVHFTVHIKVPLV